MNRKTKTPAKSKPIVDKNGFGKHLASVLKEMCRRVKAKYDDIDFKSSGWFRQYKWTREQEKSFEGWLTDYLYHSREARWELCERGLYIDKKWCKKVAEEFTFMYGWVLSD